MIQVKTYEEVNSKGGQQICFDEAKEMLQSKMKAQKSKKNERTLKSAGFAPYLKLVDSTLGNLTNSTTMNLFPLSPKTDEVGSPLSPKSPWNYSHGIVGELAAHVQFRP